jgi:hypothetical protein
VNVVSWAFPFFWDTLLVSTITSYFYTNGWNGGIPPTVMDAGHPPLFHGYLLLWWNITSRSLLFSHLAMLPVLWIAVYQFIHLSARLLDSRRLVVTAAVLFCLETTILAQSTMVSQDVVLLCFYLFGLRYILDRRPFPVAVAAVILCLTNLRGLPVTGALMITDLVLNGRRPAGYLRLLIKYIPALALFAGWNFWHLSEAGWMLFTPSEQWSAHRGWAGLKGMVANTIAILRVHLEPGRLLLYVLTGIGLMEYFLLAGRRQLQHLPVITAIPLAVLALFFIPFSNPIGHRYFMIVFSLSILLFTGLTARWKFSKVLSGLVAVVLVSGHFWVYPLPISNGWDSSLAHLSWFSADRELDAFLEEEAIQRNSIATHFPIDVSGDQKLLNSDTIRPVELETAVEPEYVIVSNISNDFRPEDLVALEQHCLVAFETRKGMVFARLYDCRGK